MLLDEPLAGTGPQESERMETAYGASQILFGIDLADRHAIIERGNAAWRGSSAELATELAADRSLWSRDLAA